MSGVQLEEMKTDPQLEVLKKDQQDAALAVLEDGQKLEVRKSGRPGI